MSLPASYAFAVARSAVGAVGGHVVASATAGDPGAVCRSRRLRGRLLTAQNARSHGQTGDIATHYAAIAGLLDLLTRCLAELGHLAAVESSTGS
jgi:hypothetical protein